MENLKIPTPDPEKEARIQELKEEIRTLKNKATIETPMQLQGYNNGLELLQKEAVVLKQKAGHIPELFDKPYKDKLKEIKKVEKLIEAKKQEHNDLKDEYFQLQGDTLRNLESETYIPYVIELNRFFWDLQSRAFQEDDPEYDHLLFKVSELFDNPPALKYMRIARRTNRRPARVLLPTTK